MASLHQGDILKVEKIKHPVLVVSKDFFNTSGEIIGCPIIKNSTAGPLHIWMSTEENEGYIQCEKTGVVRYVISQLQKKWTDCQFQRWLIYQMLFKVSLNMFRK